MELEHGVWICPECYKEALTESKEKEMESDIKEVGLKYDDGKLRYDLIPPEVIEELARVLTFGANKYADNSWQNLEDFKKRYYAAAMRHRIARQKGEIRDPESGLLHLSHELTNVAFLLWKELQEEMITYV